jgi:hypothetical protein
MMSGAPVVGGVVDTGIRRGDRRGVMEQQSVLDAPLRAGGDPIAGA